MKKLESLGRKLSKEEQKRITGGNPINVSCSVVCCNGNYFQYSGPAEDCLQGQNNACNLCSSYDGVDFFHCDCVVV